MPNNCGTTTGYTNHQRNGTMCPACKAAKARYDAQRYLQRKARGETTTRRAPLTMRTMAELIRTGQSIEKRLNVTVEIAHILRNAARQNGYL